MTNAIQNRMAFVVHKIDFPPFRVGAKKINLILKLSNSQTLQLSNSNPRILNLIHNLRIQKGRSIPKVREVAFCNFS